MSGALTFWFDFASTYSYLSAFRIGGLARAAGIRVTWQPFLLGPVFAAQGWTTSPFNIYPLKGAYMWRDMERRAEGLNLPLVRPDPFPQNSLRAARVALAALESEPEDGGPAFCRAVFAAEFGQGRDISDPATLADCLAEAGLDRALAARADDPAIKTALRGVGEEAARQKIFGAPSFTVDGELFWGDDRLEQALEWAGRG
ncbi:2-hydroxychromene-2-carboxylate isomerase [Seohaeicola saemankumensis]|nr:2-hydroxychromene-2-carboxylate isomerase [Seohaeicola saemankumensis]MCA0870601.1 2-hydroxychromene-2-carboxylate isomerase [Seohaeicola saemankumensis]